MYISTPNTTVYIPVYFDQQNYFIATEVYFHIHRHKLEAPDTCFQLALKPIQIVSSAWVGETTLLCFQIAYCQVLRSLLYTVTTHTPDQEDLKYLISVHVNLSHQSGTSCADQQPDLLTKINFTITIWGVQMNIL